MICSLNEISAMLRKAAMGSGFPVGLADAIAAAGVWLCANDLDGVAAALDAVDGGYDPAVRVVREDRTVTFRDARVGRCGVSVFELLAAGSADRVVVEDPDSPLLLEGMAGVAGSTFALSNGDGANRVSIEVELSAPSDAQGARSTAVEVDAQAWAAAGELAARVYVPATEESRLSGAGAGLTDND